MIVEQNGLVLDGATGEIIEDRFVDLDTAEQELFASFSEEGNQKLRQIKLIWMIQERNLYRQRLTNDGEPMVSMGMYLKSIAPQLRAISGSKERSLKSWLTKYRIYELQLDKSDDWLLEMGAHAELLLPAASRHDATCTLLDADQELESGGKRLGKEKFISLVEDIASKVAASKSGIPEQSWGTRDTKDVVDEIIGRVDEKVRMEFAAHWAGQDVKLDSLTFWLNDYAYKVGDIIPVEHFKKIAGKHAVEGLGDEWR